MKYQTKVTKKEALAERTLAIYFEKPEGFIYKAGQTVDVTLLNPSITDKDGNTRAYTIVSAPHEKDLAIATRIRESAFKKNIQDILPGFGVEIDGPFGSFTLHENVNRPAIMLVGGIGITPFRSVVVDALYRNLPHKMFLFFSNRTLDDAPFMEELRALSETHSNFVFVPTMTSQHGSLDWEGEKGYINSEMISRYAQGVDNAVYYLAGPQEMVKAMRKILSDQGISGDDIKSEEFSGY